MQASTTLEMRKRVPQRSAVSVARSRDAEQKTGEAWHVCVIASLWFETLAPMSASYFRIAIVVSRSVGLSKPPGLPHFQLFGDSCLGVSAFLGALATDPSASGARLDRSEKVWCTLLVLASMSSACKLF
uniref:Uncharacterized protein n=1 Tax=Noctiluca scintillans TaxID=2966 RepID=A0A7S1AK00_NOCSC|mmetsp:Transcript_49437/g.131242  ORF Transcript_49437/g.131242 Transcript_49437/m.131242 type:complete len:129 (+) Transcript_49437:198-584(+)